MHSRPTKHTCVWKLTKSKILCVQHHVLWKLRKIIKKWMNSSSTYITWCVHFWRFRRKLTSEWIRWCVHFLGDFGENLSSNYITSYVHFLGEFSENLSSNYISFVMCSCFWENSAKMRAVIDSFTNFPDKKQKRNSQKSALPVTPAINEQGWLVHLPSFIFLLGTMASPPHQKKRCRPTSCWTSNSC